MSSTPFASGTSLKSPYGKFFLLGLRRRCRILELAVGRGAQIIVGAAAALFGNVLIVESVKAVDDRLKGFRGRDVPLVWCHSSASFEHDVNTQTT